MQIKWPWMPSIPSLALDKEQEVQSEKKINPTHPRIQTDRFKNAFSNRLIFKYSSSF